jgi:hypothetical protein
MRISTLWDKNRNDVPLEELIEKLPPNEQKALADQDPSTEWLEEHIRNCKRSMKLDLWVGMPWAVFWLVVFTVLSSSSPSNSHFFGIGFLVMSGSYFVYAKLTRGTYGLNARRLKVYERLLEKYGQGITHRTDPDDISQ